MNPEDLDEDTDLDDTPVLKTIPIPGEWKVEGVVLELAAPRLPDAIRWQISCQEMDEDQEELPDLVIAAAGLVCADLPDKGRREEWPDYSDRVYPALAERLPGVAPLAIYNAMHTLYLSLRAWLNTGATPEDEGDVKRLGNG